LLNMRFSSLTLERVAKLTEALLKLQAELAALEAYTAEALWEQDLKELEEFLATDPAWLFFFFFSLPKETKTKAG